LTRAGRVNAVRSGVKVLGAIVSYALILQRYTESARRGAGRGATANEDETGTKMMMRSAPEAHTGQQGAGVGVNPQCHAHSHTTPRKMVRKSADETISHVDALVEAA
jgi:hypothetical protein